MVHLHYPLGTSVRRAIEIGNGNGESGFRRTASPELRVSNPIVKQSDMEKVWCFIVEDASCVVRCLLGTVKIVTSQSLFWLIAGPLMLNWWVRLVYISLVVSNCKFNYTRKVTSFWHKMLVCLKMIPIKLVELPITNYHWFVVPAIGHLVFVACRKFEKKPVGSRKASLVWIVCPRILLTCVYTCACRVPIIVDFVHDVCPCLLAFLNSRLGLPLDKLGTFAAAPLLSECVRSPGTDSGMCHQYINGCWREIVSVVFVVAVVVVVVMVVLYCRLWCGGKE